ncbi:MAG: LPP20 family lipoprotein [Bacteroidetes bacterium]|nr:LPP20 family lipoprotein [Bacteroidota bacterium]
MRYAASLLVLFFAVVLAGCGGSKQAMQSADTGDVPDWFTNVPQDPNFLYAANTQVSQDLQLAIDKAVTGGRSEIGRQIETRLQGLQKKFTEETGTGEDAQLLQMFTQAEKTVVSTTLSGSRIKYQKQVRDGKLWRAYVLVEYPIGAANQAFLQQIKKNDQMYTRFRASESFKELNDEVDKYEKFKKEQGPN